MNRKLIFEAPFLPGGIIFTAVVSPDYNYSKVDSDAVWASGGTPLRFKGGDETDEPVSPLRFAPERFDLGWLVKAVTDARPISHNERKAVLDAAMGARIYPESYGPHVNAQPTPPGPRC